MKQYGDSSNLNARIQLYTRFSNSPDDLGRWVFDRLDLPRRCRLLELGCGTASLWVGNASRVSAGWTVTLSDRSPGMLREARDNLAVKGLAFRLSVIDAQAIPLADSTLDAVIANHMLYHVPDRAKALSEIHRVLRPGARRARRLWGAAIYGSFTSLCRGSFQALTTTGQRSTGSAWKMARSSSVDCSRRSHCIVGERLTTERVILRSAERRMTLAGAVLTSSRLGAKRSCPAP